MEFAGWGVQGSGLGSGGSGFVIVGFGRRGEFGSKV